MKHFHLETEAAKLAVLHLDRKTEEFSGKSMATLFAFGQRDVGLVCFEGSTPWEEHPHDEFLLVVEGQTTVVMRINGEEVSATARKGDILLVPGKVWHRQDTQGPVTVMYITDHAGNKHAESL